MKFHFSKVDRNYKPNDQQAQKKPQTPQNGKNYTKGHHSQITLKDFLNLIKI